MIVLGTGSKQRLAILSEFSLPFITAVSHFDEDSISTDMAPSLYVERMAQEKGAVLAPLYPDLPLLTFDTSVYCEGRLFNKPADTSEALKMLTALQGRSHEVWSSLALHKGSLLSVESEKTIVHFRPLTRGQIMTYIEKYKPFDKAGSYSASDGCSLLIDHIEGDFYNILGIPMNVLYKALNRVGIDLWDYLK